MQVMGITPKFRLNAVLREMGRQGRRVEEAVIANLSMVGEYAVATAREEHERNYTDRSGNLRASIGYVIVRDGEIVTYGGFGPSAEGSGTDGATGAREGYEAAEGLAKRHVEGFALILVAGMYYGEYVERRDYNVVTFTKIEAERMANELVGRLFRMV